MTYECGGHEYGEQGRRYRFAPFFSRIFLLRAFRVNPFHPLRQFVLFLFSAISAMFGAVSIHLEEFRHHPSLRPIRQ